jgi:hypothetical protein
MSASRRSWDREKAIGRADRAVLDAEAAHDFPAYKEALRDLCRTARSQARSGPTLPRDKTSGWYGVPVEGRPRPGPGGRGIAIA